MFCTQHLTVAGDGVRNTSQIAMFGAILKKVSAVTITCPGRWRVQVGVQVRLKDVVQVGPVPGQHEVLGNVRGHGPA